MVKPWVGHPLPSNTWRVIPVSKWLGSPPFISHELPFGNLITMVHEPFLGLDFMTLLFPEPRPEPSLADLAGAAVPFPTWRKAPTPVRMLKGFNKGGEGKRGKMDMRRKIRIGGLDVDVSLKHISFDFSWFRRRFELAEFGIRSLLWTLCCLRASFLLGKSFSFVVLYLRHLPGLPSLHQHLEAFFQVLQQLQWLQFHHQQQQHQHLFMAWFFQEN